MQFCIFQCYNVLAQPMQRAKEVGYKFDSKILDINQVDVSMTKTGLLTFKFKNLDTFLHILYVVLYFSLFFSQI